MGFKCLQSQFICRPGGLIFRDGAERKGAGVGEDDAETDAECSHLITSQSTRGRLSRGLHKTVAEGRRKFIEQSSEQTSTQKQGAQSSNHSADSSSVSHGDM